MNIHIFRVDLRETNALLERIAKALESFQEIPAQEPVKRGTPITAKDIGIYDDEDTPEITAELLRKAGVSDLEIERLIMSEYAEQEGAE